MKSHLLAACFLAALSAVPAAAQPAPPANPDPAAVRAGAYVVEPHHTRITFAVSHMGFTTWYGDFTGASGTAVLNPTDASADQVNVSVPTSSVATTNAKLNDELRDPSWLDAAKYPTISFRSTRVVRTGPGTADVTGDFTLHGVTRPLTLHAVFNGAGVNPLDHAYTAGFQATGVIRRSDFGVTKYTPLIGDEVRMTLSAAFVQP